MEQLLQYFTPNLYQLYLTIDRTTETINGTVCIFGVPQHSEFAKFHAVGLKISSVVARKALPGDENLIYKNFSDFLDCDFEQKHGEIKIKNIFPAQNSQIQYKIEFSTTLNKNMQGCYLSNYLFNGVDKKIATTQFESHYARECFPCIDEPAAKAEFIVQLDIPDLQDDDVVLFNTPLENQKAKSFTFQRTPRMSTYLLAWVIGAFQKVETTNKNGIRVASYCALNQSLSSLNFANEVAARSLEYYDDKFGLPYPLAKLDQVALPDFEAGAMENWGLVTYRESCMLAEPNASVDTKQSVAITVTHELSHQWFGDLVTMQWWDDLWLNESFATIMEYYATDALYPELKAWQDFFTGDCVAALRRDALPGVQAVQQPVNDPAEIATLFDGAIVYAKGARLVLMLMRLMGEENFYRGVRDYFAEYQYQNTVGDDLWDKLQPYADFNVNDLMHIWISQPGYPMIWQTEDSINQQRFLINGDTDTSKWPLPKVKDDMSGHYLLNLSSKEFQAKIAAFDTLSSEQKLRLLIDRMLLAKAQKVGSDTLFDILPKFTTEDAPVWDILLSIINDLKIFFLDNSPEEALYHIFLCQLIYNRLQTIGVTSKAHDNSSTKRLRKVLAVIARFARDQDTINALAAQYSPDLFRIDAEMRGNILMVKMLTNEDTTFSYLLTKYQSEPDPELKDDILCTLANAKDPQNISTVMQLLSQPEVVRPQDHLYLYIYLLRNPAARAQTLDWLYDNWQYIETLAGEKSIEDYPRCMSSYINTRAEADKFYNFFDQHSDNPILKRTLTMARASIEAKLNLITNQRQNVYNKLQEVTEK